MVSKEDIKKLIQLWDTKSIAELMEEMNWPKNKIVSMACEIRKAGYGLTKKRSLKHERFLIT